MTDQITLYTGHGAAGMAVHWLLLELDIPFALVLLDLDKDEQHLPAYRAVNATGRVPALVVNGRVHLETTAILMWLAEQHPQKGLAPLPGADDRANYLQWMVFLANNLMPAYRAWFYADGTTDPKAVEAIRLAARHGVEACFDQIEQQLSDGRTCLLGPSLSVADLLLTMLLRWSRKMPRPSAQWTHIGRYQARMKQSPTLREVHRREGLTDWINDG